MYKVDFEKAFDTVNWCFLNNLLIERGFPPRWTSAGLGTLQTASSAIRVNGAQTNNFMHKRGLHQGVPLSPMLFILVADCLNSFLHNTMPIQQQPAGLHSQVIQYVDDTLIICEAQPSTLKIIHHVLKVYTELTGLKINREKSSFVPISIPGNLIWVIQAIFSSPPAQLPFRYLRLPLTTKKPR